MRVRERKANGSATTNVVVVVLLLALVASSFYIFVRDNGNRVLSLTNSFIEAATTQAAERLDDMIYTAQRSVDLLALLYGSGSDGTVDAPMLQDMIDHSPFDYVEFISADGLDLTADGRTADLSDRDYFKDGMAGNSGIAVVHNSRITNETLLIFYAPAYFHDQINGVFSGILRGESLVKQLSMDYFGFKGKAYLIKRNGDVVVSTENSDNPFNLVDALAESGRISEEELRKLTDALETANDIDFNSFNFQGTKSAGSGYIVALQGGEFALMQSFPSAVNQSMARNANAAGIRLELELGLIFIAYLVYILLKNRRQKRKLVSEKQEMSDIVSGVTQLFTRFALVDFNANTYEYLEGVAGEVSRKGSYPDLMRMLDERYVRESSDETSMTTRISPDFVREHLTPDVPYLQYEYQINLDSRRWENMSILCLRRENGVPVNVLYAIQDVTALKEEEAHIRLALKNASDAAEAANRAKSDFLARMSHDIRTPMNAIMGMTAVAAMHMDDRERLTDCLNKITISSRHLLALINDVLDMSKIESGKVTLNEEPFSLPDLADSIFTIMRAQANAKKQRLDVRIRDVEHEHVIGDTLRLRQIFVNILGNAVKFTPPQGSITFSIRELPSTIRGMASYEFVCEDTGIGMDKEFLKTIFDPFSRSEQSDSRKIEGTGLGMSIARNIVRMMDGDIQVESELGVGSKFTVQIYLKIQEQEAEDVTALADLRVLVADDDESACLSTCDTLEGIGMRAEWVLSGEEAVTRTVRAHEEGRNFSAVILDWKMPEMDGVETARRIRARVGSEVPIIILSAYDWTEIEAEARLAGVQAFIVKPLFRSRLIYALKSVLAPAEGQQVVREANELEEADFSGKRVLLAEDNELNREIAAELLGMTGAEVEMAEDGAQAVEMFQAHPEGYYDLIFMDVQMPLMNGYEATRRIRSMNRADAARLPILAMTANAFADDIRAARESGMNDHLSKPIELPKLLEMMAKWLK